MAVKCLLLRALLRLPLVFSALLAGSGTMQASGHSVQPQPRVLMKLTPITKDRIVLGYRGGCWAFATGVPDRSITLWNPGTGAVRGKVPWSGYSYPMLNVAPDGKTWAAADSNYDNYDIHVHDRATGKEIAVLKGHTSHIGGITYAPDGRTIATSSADATVRVWNVATGKERARLPRGDNGCSVTIFTSDGRTLVTAGADPNPRIWLWDVVKGKERNAFQVGWNTDRGSLAVAADGRTVALADLDGTVHVWNGLTAEELATYQGGATYARLAFSPDGKLLAVEDTYEGPRAGKWQKHFSDLGTKFLFPDRPGTVLLDRASGQVRYRLPGYTWPAFSADGRTLYTFSPEANALALWDVPPQRRAAK